MPPMVFKNRFAQAGSGIEQQRADLFKVSLIVPQGVVAQNQGGSNLWDEYISFAIKDFPFPERAQTTIPIKFLQQTNHQLGADEPSAALTMNVRYAFSQPTAALLERWRWMASHPYTGGVSLSTNIKTSGTFYWLAPNVVDVDNTVDDGSQMSLIAAYNLEGIMPIGLKPSNADMEQSNGLVGLEIRFQVDRYYPLDPANLQLNIGTAVGTSVVSGLSLS